MRHSERFAVPRNRKTIACIYQQHPHGRARWIADRYKLPLDLVIYELGIEAVGCDAHPVYLQSYMLSETPDCNRGCSLCAHLRPSSNVKPDVTPQAFISRVA